jgi:hypothetical protein
VQVCNLQTSPADQGYKIYFCIQNSFHVLDLANLKYSLRCAFCNCRGRFWLCRIPAIEANVFQKASSGTVFAVSPFTTLAVWQSNWHEGAVCFPAFCSPRHKLGGGAGFRHLTIWQKLKKKLLRAHPRVYEILLGKPCVLSTFKKICQINKEFISNSLT